MHSPPDVFMERNPGLHYTTTLLQVMKQNDTFLCKALGCQCLKLGTALIFSISTSHRNSHDLRPKQKVTSQLFAQCVIYCKFCSLVKKVSRQFVI